MKIGVVKERKILEKRVALTPSGVKELSLLNHQVYVESSAGFGSFFSDEDYRSAGAEIIESQSDLWKSSDLIVKVKEPHESEFAYMRKEQILFTYLHLASFKEITKNLTASGITSIAYELIEENNQLVLLKPMSEIAGKLAIQNGAYHLQSQNAGRGVLLGGTENTPGGVVTIIGAGNAGKAAANVACGMGARVNIFDLRDEVLKGLEAQYLNLKGYNSKTSPIRSVLAETDLLVLAVLIPGAKAPHVISKEDLKHMQPGSVVVDISIDQGGAVEGIQSTTLENPVYQENSVLLYAVGNMPAQTARTSTQALTTETIKYVKLIADSGLAGTLKNVTLKKAICTHDYKLCNLAVANAHQFPFSEI